MSFDLSSAQLIGFLLALARTSSWMVISPPFNTKMIPRLIKVGAAVGLSLPMSALMPLKDIPLNTLEVINLLFIQIATGLCLGFLTMLLFAAVQAAGSLIDLFGGFTLGQALDPMSNNQTSIFGRFYQLLATVLLFVSNGRLLVFKGFMTSFEAVPLSGIQATKMQELILRDLKLFMIAAVEIAGPLLGAFFITEVVLGLLTKAAPQLNVFTFGFPLKILMSILIVSAAIPLLPGALDKLVDMVVRDGVRALKASS